MRAVNLIGAIVGRIIGSFAHIIAGSNQIDLAQE